MPIPSEDATDRLEGFAKAQVDIIRGRMGAVPATPWPSLEGCLAVLFTSRTGSTFLARGLETVFDIGRMRESLDPERVRGRGVAQALAGREEAWFAFKGNLPGVIVGELSGFIEAYLQRTVFVLLTRRDVVAQAVSLEKAMQTGQWHSTQTPKRIAIYDGAKIANAIRNIVSGVEQLRRYAHRSERPWLGLIYEDFSNGDFTPALAACEALGVPRRRTGCHIRAMPVERTADAANEAWTARFREEMDAPTRELIEQYRASL